MYLVSPLSLLQNIPSHSTCYENSIKAALINIFISTLSTVTVPLSSTMHLGTFHQLIVLNFTAHNFTVMQCHCSNYPHFHQAAVFNEKPLINPLQSTTHSCSHLVIWGRSRPFKHCFSTHWVTL